MAEINDDIAQKARDIAHQMQNSRYKLNDVAQLKQDFNMFVLDLLKQNGFEPEDYAAAQQLLEKPEHRQRADEFAVKAVGVGEKFIKTDEKIKTNLNPLGSKGAAQKLAVDAFKFAAEQGNRDGLRWLIKCYQEGIGMDKPNMQISMQLTHMLKELSPEQIRATKLPTYNPLLIHANQGKGRGH